MAKKQTRRCISVSQVIYDKLVEYKRLTNKPISATIERLVKEYFDENQLNAGGEDESRQTVLPLLSSDSRGGRNSGRSLATACGRCDTCRALGLGPRADLSGES